VDEEAGGGEEEEKRRTTDERSVWGVLKNLLVHSSFVPEQLCNKRSFNYRETEIP
jgi:hypothetical protein